jgi:hypothetical protein
MRRRTGLCALAVVTVVTAGVASGALEPARTLARPGPTGPIALAGSRVAFVVGETPAACDHVESWSLTAGAVVRFGRPSPLPCKEAPSTGSGVWSLSTSRSRAVWLTYVGGNIREWELWTATPTRPAPRRLRLVALPVEEPPPIVLGPGSPAGVPYASGRMLVFIGDDGARRFARRLDASVVLVAAGAGGDGRGTEVAAVLETGAVVTLDVGGNEVARWAFATATVEAVRVAGGLVAVQTRGDPDRVSLLTAGAGRRASWPVASGARLVGLAPAAGRLGPRILLEHSRGAKSGDLWLLGSPAGAGGGRIADGTGDRPARGALDSGGVAWTIGRTVRWSPLPSG